MTPRIFRTFQSGLAQVHSGLRSLTDEILAGVQGSSNDAGRADERIAVFCQEFFDHHKSEDSFFFPAFRAAGRLRSSDVAFLDARDAEHRDMHRLAVVLRDVGLGHRHGRVAARDFRLTVESTLADMKAICLPHFEAEEATLTAEHLATLISETQFAAVHRDMGRNWNRR